MSEIIGGSSICSTWETYCDAVKCWNEASQTIPGAFSYSVSERMWALSRSCPLPDASTIPIITLPLRLHLVQGPELGCSLTWEQCFLELVPMMNNYWRQAGIEWDLIEVLSKDWPNDADGGRSLLEQARHDINKLARDPETGMMAGKDRRRAIFLDKLIPEALQQRSTYDVYMFDFIGNGSQGKHTRAIE